MTSPLSVRLRKYCPACGSLQVTKLIRKHAYHCNICDWAGEGVTHLQTYHCNRCKWEGEGVITLPTIHLMKNGRAKNVTTMYLSFEGGM